VGWYLNETFKKGNNTRNVILVMASRADQGFPLALRHQHQPTYRATKSGEQVAKTQTRQGANRAHTGRGANL
jgi:hypothetical protein